MYVIQTRREHSRQQLHELDRKGLKLAKLAYPNDDFEVISGLRAHHWVKNGWPHSTPLYVGYDGRIRYARDEVAKPRRRKVTSQQIANALNSAIGEKLFTGAKR